MDISWRFLLLQESCYHEQLEPGMEYGLKTVNGHTVYYTPGAGGAHGSSIVLHRSVKLAAEPVVVSPFTLFLKTSWDGTELLLCSSHLPQRGLGDEEYKAEIDRLDRALTNHVGKDSTIFIGIDSNANFGCGEQSADGNYEHVFLGPYGLGDWEERATILYEFIDKWALTLTNTYFESPIEERHTCMTAAGNPRLYDFVLCSDFRCVENSRVFDHHGTQSDHRPVICSVNFDRVNEMEYNAPQNIVPKMIGWRAHDEPSYVGLLHQQLAGCSSLNEASDTIATLAVANGRAKYSGKTRKKLSRSHLRSLQESWRQANAENRKHYGKLITIELRRLSKEKRIGQVNNVLLNQQNGGWGKNRSKNLGVAYHFCRGTEQICRPQEVASLVEDHFANQFNSHVVDENEDWAFQFSPLPDGDFVVEDTLLAISDLKFNKSCAQDGLVAEMIKPILNFGATLSDEKDIAHSSQPSGSMQHVHKKHKASSKPSPLLDESADSGPGAYGSSCVVQFDGACRGSCHSDNSSCGAVLFNISGEEMDRAGIRLRDANSVVAEYHGCILGLELAVKNNVRNVVIEGDSQIIIYQCARKWKVLNPRTRSLWSRINALMSRFEKVSFKHVRRAYNKVADSICNKVLNDGVGLTKYRAGKAYHQCVHCVSGFVETHTGETCQDKDDSTQPLFLLHQLLKNEIEGKTYDFVDGSPPLKKCRKNNEKSHMKKQTSSDTVITENIFPHEFQATRNNLQAVKDANTCKVDVPLLPKQRIVTSPTQLRPICLIPLLHKIAGGQVLKKIESYLHPSGEYQFAYKGDYQASEVSFIHSLILQKNVEWKMKMAWGSADVPKAFDNVSHKNLIDFLFKLGVPKTYIAWVARELRSTRLKLRVHGAKTNEIGMSRGIPQGSKFAPQIFISLMGFALEKTWQWAQQHKIGFPLDDGEYIPFTCYSDNLFLYAECLADLKRLRSKLHENLTEIGLSLPEERMEWQTREQATASDWPNAKFIPMDTSMKVIGTRIDSAGRTHVDVTTKCAMLLTHLNDMSDFWTNKRTSRRNKMTLLHRVAESCLLWSAGCWTISTRDRQRMRATILPFERQCMNMPRYLGETEKSYFHRLGTSIRDLKKSLAIPDLDLVACQRLHRFAGHVIRAGVHNEQRLSSKIVMYRDKNWCRTFAEVMEGTHQGHPGRFNPFTWERQLDSFYTDELHEAPWKELARDRVSWRKLERSFIEGQSKPNGKTMVYGRLLGPKKRHKSQDTGTRKEARAE